MRQLVPTVKTPQDWAPLGRLIAIDRFERIGTFLGVQNWQQYTEMLTGWANSVDSFETTMRRVTELPQLVYFEVEERHILAGRAHVVNSMTVFEFDADANAAPPAPPNLVREIYPPYYDGPAASGIDRRRRDRLKTRST